MSVAAGGPQDLLQELVDALYLRGVDAGPGEPDLVEAALTRAAACGVRPTMAGSNGPVQVMVHASALVEVAEYPVPDGDLRHVLGEVIGNFAAILSDDMPQLVIDHIELA